MLSAMIATPLGPLAVESLDDRIARVRWIASDETIVATPDDPLLVEAARQLTAYFDGRLETFDLPLMPSATSRGQALRDAIIAIPYGQTASYGQVAHAAGSAPRALGQACARNPLPVIVPCHRVLAATGAIGNYTGGKGTDTKLALLRLERVLF